MNAISPTLGSRAVERENRVMADMVIFNGQVGTREEMMDLAMEEDDYELLLEVLDLKAIDMDEYVLWDTSVMTRGKALEIALVTGLDSCHLEAIVSLPDVGQPSLGWPTLTRNTFDRPGLS